MDLSKKIFIGGVSSSGKDTLIDSFLSSFKEEIEYFHFSKNMKSIAKSKNIEFISDNFELLEEKTRKRLNNIRNHNLIINGHYSIPIYSNSNLIGHRTTRNLGFDAYVLLDASPEIISQRRTYNNYKNLDNIVEELKREKTNFVYSSKKNQE